MTASALEKFLSTLLITTANENGDHQAERPKKMFRIVPDNATSRIVCATNSSRRRKPQLDRTFSLKMNYEVKRDARWDSGSAISSDDSKSPVISPPGRNSNYKRSFSCQLWKSFFALLFERLVCSIAHYLYGYCMITCTVLVLPQCGRSQYQATNAGDGLSNEYTQKWLQLEHRSRIHQTWINDENEKCESDQELPVSNLLLLLLDANGDLQVTY